MIVFALELVERTISLISQEGNRTLQEILLTWPVLWFGLINLYINNNLFDVLKSRSAVRKKQQWRPWIRLG